MAESEDEKQQDDDSADRGRSWVPSVQVIGWAFILLILAGYFAWMIIEMGGHAVTRAWPMLGVFAAAVVGGVAAALGLVIGRRTNDSG